MQLSAPNLLSDTGQRKFQIWWWRQIESPSRHTFIKHEWKYCIPKVFPISLLLLWNHCGFLEEQRIWMWSLGELLLILHDPGPVPPPQWSLPWLPQRCLIILHCQLHIHLVNTFWDLLCKDRGQISKTVNVSGFEARLCIWILVAPF